MHPITDLLNQKKLEPSELSRWIAERADRIRDRWLADINSRDGWTGPVEALITEFFDLFVAMLPHGLGPFKEQVEPLWVQCAGLFGSMAAQRGLAAGEVIEEFQMLRDAVIRFLYAEPPVTGALRISLRDLLRVNRLIDRGVTQSSVGHTDRLFFALFQGRGISEGLTEENLTEIRRQLDSIRREFQLIERGSVDR